jgi:hypothetical protein
MSDIKTAYNAHSAKSVSLPGSQKKISKAPEQIDTYNLEKSLLRLLQ